MAPTLTCNCPYCGQKHNLRSTSVGIIKRCSNCGRRFRAQQKATTGCCGLILLVLLGACIWGVFFKEKPPKGHDKDQPVLIEEP